jgi:hypothetical protein
MAESIKRRDVLTEMEIKENGSGKPVYFAIQFYKANGELVSLHRAKSCGLRADMSSNRLRGVQAVDIAGNPEGHIYPISIDNIRTFNHIKVVI